MLIRNSILAAIVALVAFGGTQNANAQGAFGPCTPAGAPHHYTFTLIATDLEPTALQGRHDAR